jgi:hypothetical protein
VLLGVAAACVARDELLAMGKAVVKKATQKVAAAKARAGP